MYSQFNIQQFHVLPTLYLYVLCASEDKQQLFPYKPEMTATYNRDLNLYSPVVSIYTASLTFNNSTFCPQSTYLFCVDLRISSDYFPINLK